MFKRLRKKPISAEPDLRPALLSLVCLLFILLPTLLITTSLQRLSALAVALSGRDNASASVEPGIIEDIEVQVEGETILLRTALRTLDIRAMTGERTWNELLLPPLDGRPDWLALRQSLQEFHRMDPSRRSIRLVPDAMTSTSTLTSLMDVVRASPEGPLFDQIELAPPQPLTGEPSRGLPSKGSEP